MYLYGVLKFKNILIQGIMPLFVFYMDIVAMPVIAVYMYIFIEGRKVK